MFYLISFLTNKKNNEKASRGKRFFPKKKYHRNRRKDIYILKAKMRDLWSCKYSVLSAYLTGIDQAFSGYPNIQCELPWLSYKTRQVSFVDAIEAQYG